MSQEVDYAEAELRYAAGLVKEKQATWGELIETVVSDRLEEDEEPTIEVGYGPSPVEVASPLLDMLSQFPHQFYKRPVEGEWPELTQEEIERLAEIRAMPDDNPALQGVDPAVEGSDETAVREFYKGQIVLAFGVPADSILVAGHAFTGMISDISITHGPLCTPFRNVITGV